MAKVQGFRCDIDDTFIISDNVPDDWYIVHFGGGRKEVCSAKCLATFARARREVESTKPQLSIELKNWMTRQGKSAHSQGQIIANHVRKAHEIDGAVESCLVCEFLTSGNFRTTGVLKPEEGAKK